MRELTKWLKSIWVVPALLSLVGNATAQPPLSSLTLDKAYQLARSNYPLIRQTGLMQKASFLTIENIRTALLPQFSINGQASYQSDVTSISVPIPGFNISPLSKDQYKVWGELNQLIYDGNSVKNQKEIQERASLVEDQKTEVALYKLRDQINQLYLGVLLIEAQAKQTILTKENILIGLNTVKAQLANGTVFKSAQWVLEAQALQVDQKITELNANKIRLIRVMELFIHQPISNTVQLETPVVTDTQDTTLQRPELTLYAYQDSLWLVQNKMIASKTAPRVSLFAQGGYGKPGFNFLKNEFSLYGIGGIRFNWSLSSLYTAKREHRILDLNRKINDVQRDVFVFNTETQLTEQQAETGKLKSLTQLDEQIIEVRKKITESAKAQLQNGAINANDYLREINNEDQSRSALILHKVQLLQSLLTYQTIKGNP